MKNQNISAHFSGSIRSVTALRGKTPCAYSDPKSRVRERTSPRLPSLLLSARQNPGPASSLTCFLSVLPSPSSRKAQALSFVFPMIIPAQGLDLRPRRCSRCIYGINRPAFLSPRPGGALCPKSEAAAGSHRRAWPGDRRKNPARGARRAGARLSSVTNLEVVALQATDFFPIKYWVGGAGRLSDH